MRWLQVLPDGLAVIRLGMVVTTPIIESDVLLILGGAPQVQITICGIVTVRLVVPSASEPPRRAIRCPPRRLPVVA